mgnify:CR=1 FL=1
MRFHPLDKLINLHDDYSRQFKIDNLQLLLVQRLGELFLIEAHCPHRGHPLSTASINGDYIECPQHQYRLRRFEIVYEGNEIGLMLDE